MIKRVAAIDCGTNSLRLLIADVDPDTHELTDVVRRMEIVRLGQGVDATGMLAPAALARTMVALAAYADEIKTAGATAVRMVATSATRDAGNAADFTTGVLGILGVAPEVISGDEEARLSFAGATAELAGEAGSPVPPYLVVDIGGGSTEFVLGGSEMGQSPLAALSVNIGCVRLTERHLRSDPPSAAQVEQATADIDKALDDVAAAIAVPDARTLVGLAGSVTTVTAVALHLPAYDPAKIHHARISAGAVDEVTRQLLGQTREQRAAIPSMHPGRIDVIGAGSLILDRVIRRFGFAEVVTSEHDILDGIAWSLTSDV